MARIIVLLLFIGYSTCMKMQETVERTVMVRTSGSDLQPEATGFIYKRGTNGEAVVTKLGESEVMEQLSKLYDPQEFKGTLPSTGPFAKQNAELKSEKVIPVEEDNVDGIADDDEYKKIIDEYANNYDDYLKGLGNFKEYNKEFGFDVHHAYKPKAHKEYDSKKYESFYLAHELPYGKNDAFRNEYKVPQAFRYKNNEKDDKDAKDIYSNEFKHLRETANDGNDKNSKENDSNASNEDSTTNSYETYGAKSGSPASDRYSYKNNN